MELKKLFYKKNIVALFLFKSDKLRNLVILFIIKLYRPRNFGALSQTNYIGQESLEPYHKQ